MLDRESMVAIAVAVSLSAAAAAFGAGYPEINPPPQPGGGPRWPVCLIGRRLDSQPEGSWDAA